MNENNDKLTNSNSQNLNGDRKNDITQDSTIKNGQSQDFLLSRKLTEFLHSQPVRELDKKIDKLFDKIRDKPLMDRIFYTASQLGDQALVWQLLAAFKALFGDKKHQKNFYRLSTSLAFESLLVNGILKSLFPRERPDVEDGERPLYLRQPITASFPSGHASAAALAILLLKTSKKKSPFSLLTWILAGIVATSRVYVKIHHASDVLAGAAVGYSLGKLIKKFWKVAD